MMVAGYGGGGGCAVDSDNVRCRTSKNILCSLEGVRFGKVCGGGEEKSDSRDTP